MTERMVPGYLEEKISEAINIFWSTRDRQTEKQGKSGSHDRGNRGAVTGGKQLDGFVELIKDVLVTIS